MAARLFPAAGILLRYPASSKNQLDTVDFIWVLIGKICRTVDFNIV